MSDYILVPGVVRSNSDGDYHYISAPTLARLYGLRLEDCQVFNLRHPAHWRGHRGVFLHPRRDGKYVLPPRNPKVHTLKTWPKYFADVADGRKTFEVRKDDRGGFQVGDTLRLQEYDPVLDKATGRNLCVRVCYVLPRCELQPDDGYVVLGVEKFDAERLQDELEEMEVEELRREKAAAELEQHVQRAHREGRLAERCDLEQHVQRAERRGRIGVILELRAQLARHRTDSPHTTSEVHEWLDEAKNKTLEGGK